VSEPVVLDASALLALLNEETGAEEVAGVVTGGDCRMSAVNWSEVLARIPRMEDAERGQLDSLLDSLPQLLAVVAFDEADAGRAAALRAPTERHGLSLGDRACLALALRSQSPVLTADRAWADVDVGVEIRLIR
jgi:PIN domain nuclease of toxin-antitoxin system